MGKRRYSKRDSSIYDDPSERMTENNRLYDSFTREDVAVHRKINQYTFGADPNSDLPEVKRQVLERFVRMPRKIITRSMLTFINSSSDSGTTSKSLNIRPIPTPSTFINSPSPLRQKPDEIDPRSSGEAVKYNASIQGCLGNMPSVDLRKTSHCCGTSPVPPPIQDPEPAPIDRRSFGESLPVQRNVGYVSKPDTWNMASITQVLKGFEVSSSISTKVRSCQTFGRSTFTMTGNSNLSRLHRSKLPGLPQVTNKKPSPFRPATESPPTFRPPVTDSLLTFRPPILKTVPPFQQSVQPSPPKPPISPVDPKDSMKPSSTGMINRNLSRPKLTDLQNGWI